MARRHEDDPAIKLGPPTLCITIRMENKEGRKIVCNVEDEPRLIQQGFKRCGVNETKATEVKGPSTLKSK